MGEVLNLKNARRVVSALMTIALLTAPVGITAQTGPVDPRMVPSGSPLSGDPQSGQQQDQGQQQQIPTRSSSSSSGTSLGAQQDSPSFSPTQIGDSSGSGSDAQSSDTSRNGLLSNSLLRRPAKPGEFEDYIARVLGRPLPRFGANLMLPSERDFATPATATVPPDYILNVGDTVSVALTGSIDGTVDRQIDTDGRIFLPKVGSITLAGVRYGDLRSRISAAIGRQYRGYSVTVGIKRLRGIRVYVTGFANNPGAFTVSSLSTIANAIFSAGGPTAGGSFRSVKLYRRGAEVADFDMYQLLRGGNRLEDAVLQNEDVLFIPPAGPQVAVIGSVNEEAIYETRPGESLDTALAFAGGPNSLGDPSRVILYRTSDTRIVGPQQIRREQAGDVQVAGGDVLQILSKGTLTQPMERQAVLVRIEGEVNRPGNYYVAPNTPMGQVIASAGGLTSRAFPFGTRLQRISVRAQQRESYLDAIRQLELSIAASPITADRSTDAGDRDRQLAGGREVLERLRRAEPDGRVVLDIAANATSLPGDILLENNDSIVVPPRATTVGVFGAVYRPASFLLSDGRPLRVADYIERAGGTLRAADRGGIFVVRANGSVLSTKRGALKAPVLPGDVIFVPVRTQGSSFWAKLRDITTILFQIGLSAATISAIN